MKGLAPKQLDFMRVKIYVDDGIVEFFSLEAPERDVDGDTSLAARLRTIHDEGVLEGKLSKISNFQIKCPQVVDLPAST